MFPLMVHAAFGTRCKLYSTKLLRKKTKRYSTTIDKPKAKKGKIVTKSTGSTYQFQIMESINVPRADIKKFADPLH
jgi:hypothetical protein